MTDEDDDDGPVSGPYCPHWDNPADCEEKCASCGHACSDHAYAYCKQEGCECEEFQKEDE